MFDIVDRLAVREALDRQAPVPRRICMLLMQGFTQQEIAQQVGLHQSGVCRHIAGVRLAFLACGFPDPTISARAPESHVRVRQRLDAGRSGPDENTLRLGRIISASYGF